MTAITTAAVALDPSARALAIPSVHDWDRLPGMMMAVTPEARLVALNEPLALRCGWRRGSADWLDTLDADLHSGVRSALANAADGHGSLDLELHLERPDGANLWLACDGRWNADSQTWLCVLHDITARKSTEVALLEQTTQLRVLADNVPALIAYYDAQDFRCSFANRRYAQALGWTTENIVGRTAAEIVGERGWAQIRPYIEAVVETRRQVSYEREMLDADGKPQWLEVDVLPNLGEHGELYGAFVRVTDITKHRLAERAVRESEERLAKFMDASVEGILFHRNGTVIDVNGPILELTGYSRDEAIGRRSTDFVAPDQFDVALQVLKTGAETAFESVVMSKAGERIAVELITRSIERGGEKLRLVIVRDIRERLAAQARIHHLAHHDALTGLPNRTAFIQQLEQLTLTHRAGDAPIALLFIDLDHFKRVNDSLGHLAGDQLLKTVTARITAGLRGGDLVARFGGDEFMVLLTGAADREVIQQVADKLLIAIEQPVELAGRLISVSPSIGVAVFPEHGHTPAELIQHADAAMYLAKSRGRATVQFFDPAVASEAYDALVVESQLAHALEAGAFELHYQPQIRASDGALVGVEALIRWHHPVRGLLLPDEFIPVAEQRRLMLPIGQWVLCEAMRCARRWQAEGLHLPIAVNLSNMQFQQRGFVEALAELLEHEQVEGTALELELTERMLMDDLAEVKAALGRIKAMGIRIAIDDFGTGYSSLGHLKDLPIDRVKIDRSFVQDLPHRPDACAIARAIVELGHSLGMSVVAEGVETRAQQSFLRELGCDEFQGLLLSEPLPEAGLRAWALRHAKRG
ncbi:MAG TPA: EAL domain-containing protein [Methylibium sp.]|uniref:sensor domain-containing protein n=1 Tax=Methylibium sp. TaxID=2067992 RepID=UPI002DBA153B|nr:EAL domain-containing protein [Methylibium sp.]HEU4458776.1 EAL domain-containing protein [Methylibium sp.]